MPFELEPIIPGVGLRHLSLYEPADQLFAIIKAAGEVSRQNEMRHLGGLSHVLPGARQARWDYTSAMLYYIGELNLAGFNSRFRIGRIQFSSGTAALQRVALVWNAGHLPGTFPVEKGVCRYLLLGDPARPAQLLRWPHDDTPAVLRAISQAGDLLLARDYHAVARVLAILKLYSWASSPNDYIYEFTASRFRWLVAWQPVHGTFI